MEFGSISIDFDSVSIGFDSISIEFASFTGDKTTSAVSETEENSGISGFIATSAVVCIDCEGLVTLSKEV